MKYENYNADLKYGHFGNSVKTVPSLLAIRPVRPGHLESVKTTNNRTQDLDRQLVQIINIIQV